MNTLAINQPIEFIKLKFFESRLSQTIFLVDWLLQWKKRKTWEDMFMHSYRMFKKCIEARVYDELILKSIFLHDIIEDSDFTVFDVKNKFGFDVSFIVEGMTCLDENWEKIQKQIYFEKFEKFSLNEWRILFVKLFDSIDNLKTLHWLPIEKQISFLKEKREIFLPIFTKNIENIPFDFRSIYILILQEFKNLLITFEYEQ